MTKAVAAKGSLAKKAIQPRPDPSRFEIRSKVEREPGRPLHQFTHKSLRRRRSGMPVAERSVATGNASHKRARLGRALDQDQSAANPGPASLPDAKLFLPNSGG